jgi:hypothetical protein
LNEKEAIEKATADAFIELYNCEMGASFSIVEYSDAPDIRCKDSKGNIFNFEITLTEDQPKDMQAALGRSNHRRIEALRNHLADVSAGKANLGLFLKTPLHFYTSEALYVSTLCSLLSRA